MNDKELKKEIEKRIRDFKSLPFQEGVDDLLATLGYTSQRRLPFSTKSTDEFLSAFGIREINVTKAKSNDWLNIHVLFQLTADELALNTESIKEKTINQSITSYLFFCLELKEEKYSRTSLVEITREINKHFLVPVMLIFMYGEKLSIAIIDRRPNKREPEKDVLEKVVLIKDISINNPHRAHIEILYDLSYNAISEKHTIQDMEALHIRWQEVLNTKELNKKFYSELSNWYFCAAQECIFPVEAGDDETRNPTSVIRLITRLIFVWFIKEKGLVPEILFEEDKIKNILVSMNPKESTYYKAILQNLFFATLNQEDISKRQFKVDLEYQGKNKQYGVTNVFRYKDAFRNPQQALEIFRGIPFLNGGLFECLDCEREEGEAVPGGCEAKIRRVDGFSDQESNVIFVPNELFFGKERNIDLNEIYGTRNKHYQVRGLLQILHDYKFTIEENTPIEEEIALDPELLGRVFENLLAAYNPETKTTARKATGSYYTPREIVNYMVDESLLLYLDQKLREYNPSPKSDVIQTNQSISENEHKPSLSTSDNVESSASPYEDRLRELFSYSGHENPFNQEETQILIKAIDEVKVLDPACGSGAFPMGVLHRLVFLLGKLDPHNRSWKQRQLDKTQAMEDIQAREAALRSTEHAFKTNELDYGRKLFLIQNCIYGVDIQPIAVQIAKLRFFISLVVDQKIREGEDNKGIASLPNLESKFVAANTLIDLEKPSIDNLHQMALGDNVIDSLKKEIKKVRASHFNAHTRSQKAICRAEDKELRKLLRNELEKFGWSTSSAKQLSEWDPYEQNKSADFFDLEWMYSIENGFDCVIGNPPYLRQEDIAGMKQRLSGQRYEVFNNTSDIYTYFFEKGLSLIKQSGILCLITSNKWMKAKYGGKLRKLLKTNTMTSLQKRLD